MASSGADIEQKLREGDRSFKFELSYLPFFKNKKLFPLTGSGGFEIQIAGERHRIAERQDLGRPVTADTRRAVDPEEAVGQLR